ncbi:helix-turn-helix domain-containing protein [Lichenibacterium dinghuense]|uniref:helix-turn-helix domain-containing protein n=1 Tax=Lichenibacterium dinghuense TaxID=2895977 RepID=UPI001F2F619B|nr:helix-turn-helix transcriptional regulator [Lichenibacterium sp. 6Y81]
MGRRTEFQPRDASKSGRDIEFEVMIGARIREARVAAQITQRALSDAVGIAYQKLQKYELGKDRMAVSTLNRIARALKIHPGSFFDTHMATSTGSTGKGARRSAELFQQVRDPRVAKTLLALVRELGKGDGAEQPVTEIVPPPAPASRVERQRVSLEPTRAVVDPLLALLQQAGTHDAGALAQLLGRALAEAGEIMKSSTKA